MGYKKFIDAGNDLLSSAIYISPITISRVILISLCTMEAGTAIDDSYTSCFRRVIKEHTTIDFGDLLTFCINNHCRPKCYSWLAQTIGFIEVKLDTGQIIIKAKVAKITSKIILVRDDKVNGRININPLATKS